MLVVRKLPFDLLASPRLMQCMDSVSGCLERSRRQVGRCAAQRRSARAKRSPIGGDPAQALVDCVVGSPQDREIMSKCAAAPLCDGKKFRRIPVAAVLRFGANQADHRSPPLAVALDPYEGPHDKRADELCRDFPDHDETIAACEYVAETPGERYRTPTRKNKLVVKKLNDIRALGRLEQRHLQALSYHPERMHAAIFSRSSAVTHQPQGIDRFSRSKVSTPGRASAHRASEKQL